MLCNLHTHSTFCEGNNTIEEMVKAAIEKGFDSIGFSGHGFTTFDQSYCMRETEKYIAEVKRVKDLYKNEIQVYLGIEEDGFFPINREDFEYIIGSFHYIKNNDNYYPVDSSYEELKEAIKSFGGNPVLAAESYYEKFCAYILKRKPDIIGHFDLLTKFDEAFEPLFMGNREYEKLAEKYIYSVAGCGSIFEVNTGAISRGVRKTQYPAENLLLTLKKENAPIIITSDCHNKDFLDCNFQEMKSYLKFLGFTHHYCLYNDEFIKVAL